MLVVCCVRLNCVCMFCRGLWFDVVWLGLIVCGCVRVCCCNVVVWFVCDVICDAVWLGCCAVVAVLLCVCCVFVCLCFAGGLLRNVVRYVFVCAVVLCAYL